MAFNVEDVNPNKIEDVKDVVLHIPKEYFEKMGIRIIIEVPRRSKFFGGKRKAIKFAARSFLSFKNILGKLEKKKDLDPEKEYEKLENQIEAEYSKMNDRAEKAYVDKIDEIKDLVSEKDEASPYNYDEAVSQLVDELAELHVVLIRISYSRRKKQLENEKMFKMKPDTLDNIRNNSYMILKSKKVSAEKFEELKKYLQTDAGKGQQALEVLDRYRDLNNVKEANDLINDVGLEKSMFDNAVPIKTDEIVDSSEPVETDVNNNAIENHEADSKSVVDSETNDIQREKNINLADVLSQFEVKPVDTTPQLGESMFDNVAVDSNKTDLTKTDSEEKETPKSSDVQYEKKPTVSDTSQLGQSMFDSVPVTINDGDLASLLDKYSTGTEEKPAIVKPTADEVVTDQHEAINVYAQMSNEPKPVENIMATDAPTKSDSGVMCVLRAAREEEERKKAEAEERRATQARREAIINEYKEVMKMMETVQQKLSAEGINPEGLVEGQINSESGLSV